MAIDFRIRDFAYPLRILGLRRFFEESQYFSPEKMRSYQGERLRQVISHAYNHVPYYRQVFDLHRLKPEDIRGVQDLHKIPSLSKEGVRTAGDRLLARNARRFRPLRYQTSGTAGEPLVFYLDRSANVLEFVYYWRHWSWAGYKLGSRFAAFGSVFFLHREGMENRVGVFQPLLGRLMLNSLLLSHDRVKEYLLPIRRFRPQFLRGTASALYSFALLVIDLNLPDLHFRAVFSSGEVLTQKYRSAIEKAFQCPVLDSYGHMERTVAISQCPRGGYHVNSDYGILELVEVPGGDETSLRSVLGTSLHNFAMPLLRYQIGDLIEPYAREVVCPCGRTLPLVKAIHGRTQDIIVSPDGRFITSIFLVLDFVGGVRAGQFVQETRDRLTARIVREKGYGQPHEDALRHWIVKFVGPEMHVEFEYVGYEDLWKDPSGKVRVVISQVGCT